MEWNSIKILRATRTLNNMNLPLVIAAHNFCRYLFSDLSLGGGKLVLVLNLESIFCDLLASVSLVNKNGCKGKCTVHVFQPKQPVNNF